jgi:hypothetical protein
MRKDPVNEAADLTIKKYRRFARSLKTHDKQTLAELIMALIGLSLTAKTIRKTKDTQTRKSLVRYFVEHRKRINRLIENHERGNHGTSNQNEI